jgi:phosphotransferase system enzyme I (PtsI)
VIEQANLAKVPVAVCGEMAGDVSLTRLLLAFGLRDFSMHPANILPVKQRVLNTDTNACRRIAMELMRSGDSDEIRAKLAELNRA